MRWFNEKTYNFGFVSFVTCSTKTLGASVAGAQITSKPLNAAHPLRGFFYSFPMWLLIRSLLVLLSSVAKTNRHNVITEFLLKASSVLWLKIWTISNGTGNGVRGMAFLPKQAYAVFTLPVIEVPDKNMDRLSFIYI